MAAVTEHLGFGITFSTTYDPPFAFARRMSTLDHLTKGRVGWITVTSYLPNAARNFGLQGEIEHDDRFEIADEYLEVLYKLWEGSWDDDAVKADRESGLYADPERVRTIDHAGRHFKVEGPHLVSPTIQRTPLLITATASPRGIQFAGTHADVLFMGGGDEAGVAETPYQATIGLEIAPSRPGSGFRFIVKSPAQDMPLYLFRSADGFGAAVEKHVRRGLELGHHGWRVTDCLVTLVECGYSTADGPPCKRWPTSTSYDYRKVTPLVVREALARAHRGLRASAHGAAGGSHRHCGGRPACRHQVGLRSA